MIEWEVGLAKDLLKHIVRILLGLKKSCKS